MDQRDLCIQSENSSVLALNKHGVNRHTTAVEKEVGNMWYKLHTPFAFEYGEPLRF